MRTWLQRLQHDLEAPLAVRRFGSGWFSGFFALILAIVGLCLVASLRWLPVMPISGLLSGAEA